MRAARNASAAARPAAAAVAGHQVHVISFLDRPLIALLNTQKAGRYESPLVE
jgi:hypothetical protein